MSQLDQRKMYREKRDSDVTQSESILFLSFELYILKM